MIKLPISTTFLLALLSPGCASIPSPATSPVASPLRPSIALAEGWRFTKSDVPNASAPDFNDAFWTPVSVPHTWNADDGADGGTYYRGPGWYRRSLDVTPAMMADGRRVILRFGAASLVADVYINGASVGTHKGGYAAFAFDITDAVHSGANVLAVRVNNATDKSVTPLSGDFTIYGGLYRDITLMSVSPVGISTQDDGSSGVYLRPVVTDAKGDLEVRAMLRNASAQDATVQVRCAVLDAGGTSVATATDAQAIKAGESPTFISHVAVPNPHLWDGVRDPYVYSARVEVLRDGKVVDAVTQPMGFRTFSVDPEQGLTLNGRHYDVHGVNKHQGRPSVGYADTAAMHAEDFKWVHDLGATGIRLAHYQHPDDEYGLCDTYGIVAWAELALVNALTDTPEFRDNCRQQLRELIKQSYNHPAILFWSMYNEPSVNARSGTEAQWRMVTDLNKLAKELDPGRITTGAAAGVGHTALNHYMDSLGQNFYTGWYGGKMIEWPATVAKMKRAGEKLAMSEYGAGGSAFQHEVMTTASPRIQANNGRWHPEEYQALVHEQAWAAMKDQNWLWGKFIWVMFDFSSDGRREGEHAGINDKGLVTGDRQTPKDAYFFYQANWATAPMVHLCEHRFTERAPGMTQVKLYSNCAAPKLSINGKTVTLTSQGNAIFTADIDLTPGKARLSATAAKDGHDVSDACDWHVIPGAATRQSGM